MAFDGRRIETTQYRRSSRASRALAFSSKSFQSVTDLDGFVPSQWLRSAVSRPPSPSGRANLPVFTPTHSRSNSPTPGELAKLTRKDTIEIPKMEPLGMRLSRTETVTRHAPILEHRETMEALGMNQEPVPFEENGGVKSNGN